MIGIGEMVTDGLRFDMFFYNFFFDFDLVDGRLLCTSSLGSDSTKI